MIEREMSSDCKSETCSRHLKEELWFSAGSAEELQRSVHQEAADQQLRHADKPRQDGQAFPLLQPAAPESPRQTQEIRGDEDGEEKPGAAACGRIHRVQLILKGF